MTPIVLKPTRSDRAVADIVAGHTSPALAINSWMGRVAELGTLARSQKLRTTSRRKTNETIPMGEDRNSNADKWSDRYDASKSAAQVILDQEAAAVRARTQRLREQRAALQVATPIDLAGGVIEQSHALIEGVQAPSKPEASEPSDHRRRRRWTEEQKLKILEEVAAGRASISGVARRHDVSPQLLSHWQKRFSAGPQEPDAAALPVAGLSDADGADEPKAEDENASREVHNDKPRNDGPSKSGHVKIWCKGGRVLKVDVDIAADLLKSLIRNVEEA